MGGGCISSTTRNRRSLAAPLARCGNAAMRHRAAPAGLNGLQWMKPLLLASPLHAGAVHT